MAEVKTKVSDEFRDDAVLPKPKSRAKEFVKKFIKIKQR